MDTLITAGIAGNRAEAVRWALARIRERPAYEKLREAGTRDRGAEGPVLTGRRTAAKHPGCLPPPRRFV